MPLYFVHFEWQQQQSHRGGDSDGWDDSDSDRGDAETTAEERTSGRLTVTAHTNDSSNTER